MATKNDIQVVIGGKVFTLSGYESEQYLQEIATYINAKQAEFNKIVSFKNQPSSTKNVLMQLNIADDLFKAREEIAALQAELQDKERELYDLKHELIASQIKLENAERRIGELE